MLLITGNHNSEVICPAETHISNISSLTNPCSVNDTICTMLLKCRPIRLLRYWIRYVARMGSMLVPSTLTEFSRSCRIDSVGFDKFDTDRPQQYLSTPNRTVCSGSTAQSLCGSHPYNVRIRKKKRLVFSGWPTRLNVYTYLRDSGMDWFYQLNWGLAGVGAPIPLLLACPASPISVLLISPSRPQSNTSLQRPLRRSFFDAM